MDSHPTRYIIDHFGHLMSAREREAYGHLTATMKITGCVRSDVAAQEQAKAEAGRIRSRWLSSDPEVLQLASDGYEAFTERTAQRILVEHGDQMFLNCCPRCGALARTPNARQCRICKYDWHNL